jgi:rhodanese-related sulfurtransferase
MISIPQISPQDAYTHIQDGALLLDVREIDEVNQISCDTPNILVMPMSQFQNSFMQLPTDKEIITICYSGGRSLVATQMLIAQGYSNVSNLAGGIIAWQEEGLPIR